MDPPDPESTPVIPFALAVLCSGAAWTMVRAMAGSDAVVAGRLASLVPPPDVAPSYPARRRKRRFTRFLTYLGSLRAIDQPKIRKALSEAGMEGMDPVVLAGWQICCFALGALMGLQAGAGAILTAPILAVVGYRAPLLYLSFRGRSRRDEAAAALPDAVDLLVVCTQAGLNLSLSLQRVADNTPGFLGGELRRVVEEIALGVPRGDALESWAARNPSEEIRSLVGTLANADRFGTGVAAALEGFAHEVRGTRKRRAEEQARRAPVKILFPMVFLILPAFLVLTVLPVVLGTLRSIGF